MQHARGTALRRRRMATPLFERRGAQARSIENYRPEQLGWRAAWFHTQPGIVLAAVTVWPHKLLSRMGVLPRRRLTQREKVAPPPLTPMPFRAPVFEKVRLTLTRSVLRRSPQLDGWFQHMSMIV